jgi:hypothetical protein
MGGRSAETMPSIMDQTWAYIKDLCIKKKKKKKKRKKLKKRGDD